MWWHQGSVSANDASGTAISPNGNDADSDPDAIPAMSPNADAYSWLEQSSYRRERVEVGYPSQGPATYTGSTLAILDNLIFQGDAEVKVTWGAANDVGQSGNSMSFVLPKFSNFRRVGATRDLLRLGDINANNPDKDENATAEIVDEISFALYGTTASNIMVTAAANGNLGVSYDSTDTTDFGARITTTDIGADPADRNAMFMAEFVGEGLDGPLGITGIWTVKDFAADGTTRPEATASRTDDLIGSFGADLTSFETLFRPKRDAIISWCAGLRPEARGTRGSGMPLPLFF